MKRTQVLFPEDVTDAEVTQEIAYRFQTIGRQAQGLQLAQEYLAVMDTMLPVGRREVTRPLELQRAYFLLSPRDAIHLAVMQEAGIERILTADRHFDRVAEVQRADPADLQW